MLLGLQPHRTHRLLAEMGETPNLKAELGQCLIFFEG